MSRENHLYRLLGLPTIALALCLGLWLLLCGPSQAGGVASPAGPPSPPTGVLHIGWVVHIEEHIPSTNIPDYANPVIFAHYDRVLRRLGELFAAYGARLSIQPDWTFSYAAAQYDPELYPYLESLGHDIDPHAHETTYSYPQVKGFIEQAGGHPTPVMGGVAGVGITDATYLWPISCGSPGYTGTCENHWVHYGWLTEPTTVTNFVEYALLPWIRNDFSVACTYARLWDHRNDDTPLTWRPSNCDLTGDWHIPDPNGHLVFVGRGPLEITQAVAYSSPTQFNSWHGFSGLRDFKAGPGDGLPPAWTASSTTDPDYWENKLQRLESLLKNVISPLVASGQARWGTVNEIANRYRDWERATGAYPAGMDSTPPRLTFLHPPDGATVYHLSPLILGHYTDDTGIDSSTFHLWLDGYEVTDRTFYDADGFYTRASLPPGSHSITLTLRDIHGNVLTATSTFTAVIPSSITLRLPSEGAGPTGTLAIRVYLPQAPRYPEGAPVVVYVPGIEKLEGSLSDPFAGLLTDVIRIAFLMPGGCEEGLCSDGAFDFRGEESLKALRDVLLFAAGEKADAMGRTLSAISPITPLAHNVGVFARSLGGMLSTVAAARYGDELYGRWRWLVGWENPTSDQYGELGVRHSCPITANFSPRWVNPRYTAYGTTTLVISYTDVFYAPGVGMFFDGNGNGVYDLRTLPNGCQTPDTDGDGVMELDEDFPMSPMHYGGKEYYSIGATRALSRNLGGAPWPPKVATPQEAEAFWALRSPVFYYDLIPASLPNLRVMLLLGVTDHAQPPPDKPHLHQAYDGFHRNGIWVKLNPAPTYVLALDPGLAGRSDIPDNPPNWAPADWNTIADYAYPDDTPSELWWAAAVYEMADLAREEPMHSVFLPLILRSISG